MGHGRARVIFVAHVCSFFKMGDSNVLAAFVLCGLKTVTMCFFDECPLGVNLFLAHRCICKYKVLR